MSSNDCELYKKRPVDDVYCEQEDNDDDPQDLLIKNVRGCIFIDTKSEPEGEEVWTRRFRNRIRTNSDGKIDSAKFIRYLKDSNVLTIRLDHSECLEFWIQIDLDIDQLAQFRLDDTVSVPLLGEVKGRIFEYDYITDWGAVESILGVFQKLNHASIIDGTKLCKCDDGLCIKMRHSTLPSFWIDIPLDLNKLVKAVHILS